jgi:hypothetical protein
MFCTSCKITFKQNKFVKGCRSFRLNLKRLWIWKLKRNLNLNKILKKLNNWFILKKTTQVLYWQNVSYY